MQISYDLSEALAVDEADGAVRAALDRIKAYIADQQWDEAVESLRQTQAGSGRKLIKLDDRRWISVRDYCQLRLAGLPAEGLQLYRARVDAAAQTLYERGIAEHDVEPLQTLIAQMFASSWGDRALYALGEMALERADYTAARGYWESIGRQLKSPDGKPAWRNADQQAKPVAWLAFPDTSLRVADVRARLVLVSILENDQRRATAELAAFKKVYPDAEGRMAGVVAKYADTLTALATAASKWPAAAVSGDWPTFAGNTLRNKLATGQAEFGKSVWEYSFDSRSRIAPNTINSGTGPRVAEGATFLLAFQPVIVGNRLLFNDQRRIYALDLTTGQPAFARTNAPATYRIGQIYLHNPGKDENKADDENEDAKPLIPSAFGPLGTPRFTLTAAGQRVFARMGSPITSRAVENVFPYGAGELVCVDLAQQGKLLWNRPPDSERWAFDGAPVANADTVYVAMRCSDVRPQLHVAALDAATGEMRWRQLIVAAETPARGQLDEVTNTLLTLDHNTLYVNTNLGCIAAMATDGQIKWLTRYPRSRHDESRQHFQRDLNPCVCCGGLVYAAPADQRGVLAFDTLTGQEVWKLPYPNDIVQLLGVSAGKLVASGSHLWILDANSGKALGDYRDDAAVGRGVLLGSKVLWPTSGRIRVFDLVRSETGEAADLSQRFERQPLELKERGFDDASGGNLLVTPQRLLIVRGDKIFAFSPQAGARPAADRNVTQTQ